MALKSIYQIEVDDAQFKAFAALFDKYKTALEATPGAWAKIGEGIEGAKDSFGDFGERVGKLEEELRKLGAQKITTAGDDQRSAGFWGSIVTSAKTVGSHISEATGSLLKWSVITSAFSGLIGGGALFGLDRLAGSVAGQRRSAMGLGVGYGGEVFGLHVRIGWAHRRDDLLGLDGHHDDRIGIRVLSQRDTDHGRQLRRVDGVARVGEQCGALGDLGRIGIFLERDVELREEPIEVDAGVEEVERGNGAADVDSAGNPAVFRISEGHQLLGVADGKIAQQYLVNERENRSVAANAKSQREKSNGGKPRSFGQHAHA